MSGILPLSVLIISFSGSILSAFIFYFRYLHTNIGTLFGVYFYIFLVLSTLLSVSFYFLKTEVSLFIFLFLRFFVFFLLCYPLESYLTIDLILMVTLIIEISFYLDSPGSLIVQTMIITGFLLFQKHGQAWWIEIHQATQTDLVVSAWIFIITGGLSQFIKRQNRRKGFYLQKIKHLDAAISQLSNANIGFQSYVKTLEFQVLINERKRVSREIHDTVGYALTNIIMMMEAAIRLPDRDTEKRKELLSLTRSQAQKGLAETRAALRQLRNEKIVQIEGIGVIEELVTSFRTATGIEIQVEYGNFAGFTNERVYAIIFRIIQEGLTNAFRHGMATKIRISFWNTASALQIAIHDNGIGAEKVVEGIGIAGMKERVEGIGGTLTVQSTVDGFKVIASIPHKEPDVENKSTSC